MTLNLFSAIDVERWRRIESVLDVALELPAHQVAAYLDQACAGSPALRADVEALLEADRRADLSVPTALIAEAFEVDARGALAVTAESAVADAAPPERIGRYRVLEELGRGGMGIVYRGVDETLDREVAIKSLPPSLASDPVRLGLFLREAKLLAALHHPNIAGIRGIEHTERGRYLILERIDGITLDQRLRSGALPLAAALDCAAQVATALAAAHAYGIVHRDLKPGNIMITPGGLVKVLDFGLAMHTSDGASAGGSGARDATARLGTPGYMSPEQILGQAQDERADLFALGAVLHHAVTGERAFRGESLYRVLEATLHDAPDRARIPADTPAAVVGLMERLLEKDPARRPASAAEVVAVLGAAVTRSEPATAAPWIAPARAQGLPESATPLIGRREEIAQVLGLLGRAPLVTLTGPGGCGKTRVAVEVARAAEGFSRVWFADLAAATDSAAVAAAIAAAARLRDPSERGLAAALASQIGEHAALLVLDNCDSAPDACASLASDLLAANPLLRILATHRERLGVGGEQALTIAPLATPDAETPARGDAVRAFDAARLFEACAATLPSGFRITDANAAHVAAICRDLDGVPLAIELTAASLRHQTLESAADEVAHAAARHDPLQSAIHLGYQRLSVDERRFFRALSVFAGGWNLEAAATVCGTDGDEFRALDLLTRLLDKSLVTVHRADRIEPRYRLLEPIRHFAAARAALEHDTQAVSVRHRDWFAQLARRTGKSLQGGADQAGALARLEADHQNLLAALAACEEADGGAVRALELAGSIWLFWYIRGHFARGRQALARALALSGDGIPISARAQALYAAGGLALFQGDYVEGRRMTQAALDRYREIDDRLGVARALLHLGLCESGEQHYAAARDHTQQAIDVFRRLGEPRRLSVALNNLGAFKRQQGDYAAALPDHQEAIQLLEAAGDRDGMLVTRVNLALAYARLGHHAVAAGHVDRALELVQDLRARRSGAAALEVAADVAAGGGRMEHAARLLGSARALRSAIGLEPDAGWRRVLNEIWSRVRSALGVEPFDGLVAEGEERSFEDAVRAARRDLAPARAEHGAEAHETRAPAAAPEGES